jgi:hypothetical protein
MSSCYQRWLNAGKPESGPPPTVLEQWLQIPPIESGHVPTNADVGAAGEHLVLSDLLMDGWDAFRTEPGAPYDVAVNHEGRLIRVQVKSTRAPAVYKQRVLAYEWHIRRNGFRGMGKYAPDSFDLLALVALDIRLVAYALPSSHQNLARIQPPGAATGKRFADYPFGRALAQIVNVPESARLPAAAALFDVPEQAEHERRYGDDTHDGGEL